MSKRNAIGAHERRRPTPEMKIPVNLERALLEAGRDTAFAEALLRDPSGAMASRGIEMTPSERSLLRAIPPNTLRTMVERFRENVNYKERFISRVKAAVAGTVVLAASACDYSSSSDEYPEGTPLGATPDWPANAGSGGGSADEHPSEGTGGGGVAAPDRPANDDSDGGWADEYPTEGVAGGGAAPDWPKYAVSPTDAGPAGQDGGMAGDAAPEGGADDNAGQERNE